MQLDARTVVLIIIVGSLLMGSALLMVGRGYLGQVRGLTQWAYATLLQGLGWIISGALRGVIPDLVSVVLGNGLITFSLILYYFILSEFCTQPSRARWPYYLLALQSGLLYYFVAIQPHTAARFVVLSLTAAIILFACFNQINVGDKRLAPSHRFTAGLFAACGGFMLFRTAYYGLFDNSATLIPYSSSAMNNVSYLIFYTIADLLSFGFLLMCNDRYYQQHREAERALYENNRLFNKLTAQVPGVIFQYQEFPDGRTCFPFSSTSMHDIYELSPEQVREDARPVLQLVHAEDLPKLRSSIKLSATNMQAWQCEYRVNLPEQGLRWRLGQAKPEKQTDGSILWHGFITDITARAEAEEKHRQLQADIKTSFAALQISEQRLRRVMNSSLIGIVQGDANGNIRDANDLLLKLIGHTKETIESGSLNWFSLCLESCKEKQQAILRDHQVDQPNLPFESQIRGRDGELVPVMLGLARLEGSTQEWVAFVLDLREQKRVDQLKSEFISVVSHELRTPLTSIRGSLSLLEGGALGALPPKVLQMIQIAHKNSLRLVNLVNDILDIEKLSSGKIELKMESLDLVNLVQQATEANRAYGAQFHVTYELSTMPHSAMVLGDANRLMQIMANLLSNATKFSPANERVMVAIRSHSSHSVHQSLMWRVEICDRGCGIPPEFHAHIFGRFAQAARANTRPVEGAGLGLHITKSLVEKMRGEIGFESEPQVQTIFWFMLPQELTAKSPTQEDEIQCGKNLQNQQSQTSTHFY